MALLSIRLELNILRLELQMQASKILVAGLLGGVFAISAQACFPCPPKVCCPICIKPRWRRISDQA
jgi:hypothetical protein